MRITATATALLLSLSMSLSAFAASPVYVLDGGARTIVRLDVQQGAIEAKAPLPFNDAPTDMIAAPDGKHLVVLSTGTTGNAAAAIVDAATLTASSRIDLGRGLGDVVFSRDGKSVFVLSPGKAPIAAVLFRIELATGAVARRQLDRPADHFDVVDAASGAVLETAGEHGNGTLTFLSLDSLEVLQTVDLTGKTASIAAIPGSGYLYAVGTSSVDVISIAERKSVATVSIGNKANLAGIDEATGSLFVLASNDQKNGVLYVIRGMSLAGTAAAGPGAPTFFRLTADGKRALVGNQGVVTEVALGPEIVGAPPVMIYPGWVANGLTTIDTAATQDGRRLLQLMRQGDRCCTLSVTDPAAARKVGELQVGRTKKRMLRALLAVAATGASFAAGLGDARAHGGGLFFYSVYTPASSRNPRGAFAFAADGKTVYVPDSGTGTVTAVDVETGKRIVDLDAPHAVGEVLRLGEGTIVATGEKGLFLIDTASNVVSERVELQGELHDLIVLPDATSALALSRGDVAVIDGRTGKVASRVAGFVNPVAVASMQ
jgi:DNA-binding beta-propeller fold protein YncE